MIRIRYASLPQGRHATAIARGRRIFIYFRPGLSLEQQRDALQRLQRDARLGYGPPLPALGLERALAADRARAIFRNLRAALRHHPLGALGMAAILAGVALCYLTFMASPLPPDGTLAGLPAAGLPGGSWQGTAGLLPLAIAPDRWHVPDARRRHWPAGDSGLTGPRWPADQATSPGAWWLRSGASWQERAARHRWRTHGGYAPPGWQLPAQSPGGLGPAAGQPAGHRTRAGPGRQSRCRCRPGCSWGPRRRGRGPSS